MRGKILEAWAAGRALVATPLACAGIAVTHEKNVLLADDAAGLAAATARLLEDRRMRGELGREGRVTAERLYDWDHVAASHAAIYRDVLAEQ
jgi:glycosyltransferase involved in cell wall biosynthesis